MYCKQAHQGVFSQGKKYKQCYNRPENINRYCKQAHQGMFSWGKILIGTASRLIKVCSRGGKY